MKAAPSKCVDQTTVLEFDNPDYETSSGGKARSGYEALGVFDTLDGSEGLSVIAMRRLSAETMRVALLEEGGKETVLADTPVYNSTTTTRTPNGARCVAYNDHKTLRFACEGSEPEDSGLDVATSVTEGAGSSPSGTKTGLFTSSGRPSPRSERR